MSPPLRTARFVSLALSWAFAVIAASVGEISFSQTWKIIVIHLGLNAVISGERDKQRYKQLAPPGVTVDIDISGAFHIFSTKILIHTNARQMSSPRVAVQPSPQS